MEVNITPVASNEARKKKKNPNNWKRNIKKRERYMPKTLPNLLISCSHKSKNMKCSELTSQDLRKFREAFYSKPEKLFQDNFILKYMKVKLPSRKISGERKRGEMLCHTRLYIRKFQKPYTEIQVCQKLFKRVLSITEHRIRSIAKKYFTTGKPPQENRGGDRISIKNIERKTAVMKFIESFKCIESHYCRSATSVRKYVPSELNIRKMWRMYTQQCSEQLKVRQCFFRSIFNTHYNIGFVTPRVDVCSKCLALNERIKHEEISSKKAQLMGELRLHKLKAKCFHKFLKEHDPKVLTISFDCQKNQVLPKVPDQSAYYSRQLYMYNFTIVKGNETHNIAKNNVDIYCWTENTHNKSSNEIASAIYSFIKNTELDGINSLRLMGDGCGSQNKNSTMITMLSYWLVNEAPRNLKTIEIIFPVPGHSFLPADRVFGLIEKEIRNTEQIILPQSYIDIYDKYGKVTKLGIDCPVFDWKQLGINILKRPGEYHFKFLPCKRFYLKRVKNNPQRFLIKGEINYHTDLGVFKSIIKKNKTLYRASVCSIEAGKNKISSLKIADVKKLLKTHFGENWETQYGENLRYYTEIIRESTDDSGTTNVAAIDMASENLDLCNYYPEEIGISV